MPGRISLPELVAHISKASGAEVVLRPLKPAMVRTPGRAPSAITPTAVTEPQLYRLFGNTGVLDQAASQPGRPTTTEVHLEGKWVKLTAFAASDGMHVTMAEGTGAGASSNGGLRQRSSHQGRRGGGVDLSRALGRPGPSSAAPPPKPKPAPAPPPAAAPRPAPKPAPQRRSSPAGFGALPKWDEGPAAASGPATPKWAPPSAEATPAPGPSTPVWEDAPPAAEPAQSFDLAEPADPGPTPWAQEPAAEAPRELNDSPPPWAGSSQAAAQVQTSAPADAISLPDAVASEPVPEEKLRRKTRPTTRVKLPAVRASEAPPEPDPELVNILAKARQHGASDLHVNASAPLGTRVSGQLHARGGALDPEVAERWLMSVVPTSLRDNVMNTGYADFSAEIPGAGRLRCNVSRTRRGMKGCFRMVAAQPPSLEQLGLPEHLKRISMYHQGLIVVSGPSGHGKTTTMASLVDLINATKAHHIITIEDPVEIIHPRKKAIVTQREVGSHTRSFHAALKGALREDPDVIAIGELRDRETVEMALEAAETGHVVLATMNTPSGPRTIDALIDFMPPASQPQTRSLLAGALKMVISQRLLPRADGKGRALAVELILGCVPLWSLIRDNKLFQLPSLLQRSKRLGMIRMDDAVAELVSKGVVTPEIGARYIHDKRALQNATGGGAPDAAAAAAADQGSLASKVGGFFKRK